MRARPLLWLLLLPGLVVAAVYKPVTDKSWTKKYDGHFRKYSKRYFGPGFDWRWFKAQAIVESTLKPRARNKSGATGVMQILPATYREIRKKNRGFGGLKDPRWNIAAGIYYDHYLYKRWNKRVPDRAERIHFMLGSYNAGFGGVSKAQKRAGGPGRAKTWAKVAPHAPKQARHYVKKIRAIMPAD